jgi:hypothetical protein
MAARVSSGRGRAEGENARVPFLRDSAQKAVMIEQRTCRNGPLIPAFFGKQGNHD